MAHTNQPQFQRGLINKFWRFLVYLVACSALTRPAQAESEQITDLHVENLWGKKEVIPRDLKTLQTCLIFVFNLNQQPAVETWLPFLSKLEHDNSNFKYVECFCMPGTMAHVHRFAQSQIKSKLSAYQQQLKTRICYGEFSKSQNLITIQKNKIAIILISNEGTVLTHLVGSFDELKAKKLPDIISGNGSTSSFGTEEEPPK